MPCKYIYIYIYIYIKQRQRSRNRETRRESTNKTNKNVVWLDFHIRYRGENIAKALRKK